MTSPSNEEIIDQLWDQFDHDAQDSVSSENAREIMLQAVRTIAPDMQATPDLMSMAFKFYGKDDGFNFKRSELKAFFQKVVTDFPKAPLNRIWVKHASSPDDTVMSRDKAKEFTVDFVRVKSGKLLKPAVVDAFFKAKGYGPDHKQFTKADLFVVSRQMVDQPDLPTLRSDAIPVPQNEADQEDGALTQQELDDQEYYDSLVDSLWKVYNVGQPDVENIDAKNAKLLIAHALKEGSFRDYPDIVLDLWFAHYDADENGVFSREEVHSLVKGINEAPKTLSLNKAANALAGAFYKYDVNKSGFLERDELKAFLADIWAGVPVDTMYDADVDKFLQLIDNDRDGKVSRFELFTALQRVYSSSS